MFSSQSQRVHRMSSWPVYDRIQALLQQMVESKEAWTLIEKDFPTLKDEDAYPDRFIAIVSCGFSALLSGRSTELGSPKCQLELTFSPSEIASVLISLQPFASHDSDYPTRDRIEQMVTPNDATLQSEFTLHLIGILSENEPRLHSTAEQALIQQVEQERVLNEVTKLIRQSLELPAILETAVQHVRHFLQVDRLIIYQFNIPAPSCQLEPQHNINNHSFFSQETTPSLDVITYESRRNDAIPSVLHLGEERSTADPRWLHQHHQDNVAWAINDCKLNSSTIASLLKLPQTASIRAELVTPIVVQGELWGLLIAQQCFVPRYWHDREKLLLRRIAGHLAIAIYQAKLYAELQQQKDTLEQQIIDRTQELRDTLLAAQSANRTKSEFLATMSHELRTPLTTIIGMSATLLRYYNQRGISSTLTLEKQIEYLQTIQTRGEHLLALINDILDLSQVEAGKTILQVRKFSLAQVAHQTTKLLQDKADSKQVQLCLELLTSERASRSGEPSSRPSSNQFPRPLNALDLNAPAFRFQADPQRVQQILLNLLSNAIKFTPPKGRVTLRVRVHGETAILQVEDTGIGIAQDQQSLLFQKFQQLDASYHRKYEGTGLGLALTKQFVELHGGTIEVNSTVGVGSTFTVFLPAQVLSAVDRARDRQQAPPTLHPRIVLVEEREEIATLICDLLTAADYQVIWIMDSSAAIRQIEVLQPMVAIVDLQLPGLNGYQIIRHLRTHPSTQDIKVLALTPQVPTDGSEPDVDDYFVTPLLNGTAKLLSQPEQIIDKVTTLVTRQ